MAPRVARLPGQKTVQAKADLAKVQHYREGLAGILADRPKLKEGGAGLSQQARAELRAQWRAWLDYTLALQAIADRWSEEDSTGASAVAYAAFLAQYRYAFEWFESVDDLPGADAILNEPIRELGLPAETYADYKFHYLNIFKGLEFAVADGRYLVAAGGVDEATLQAIEADRAVIWQQAYGKGPVKTLVNGAVIMRGVGAWAWRPLQRGVASWMGDTKVRRHGRNLISEKQIAVLKGRLEPGDILVARHEWYLSNIGLPGFWPHMELYVGTAETRAVYFNDPEVNAWVKSQGAVTLEILLGEGARPDSRARFEAVPDGHELRVIEAISEGVCLTSLEHGAGADSMAALRPRISKLAKAKALVRAFAYLGRPYDFDFDFDTDATMVCSEVVVKAYEESLPITVGQVLGRRVTPPNLLVQQFDEQWGRPEQMFDLVVFLDGREWMDKAIESDAAELRASWQRPKWHIWMQPAAAK